MAHLGDNIARVRGFKRLTQKELAAKLQMSQQDYSKIENSADLTDEVLQMIASALEVPTEIIKQLDNNSAVSFNQQGGNTGAFFYQVFSAEKIIEVYEKLLHEKDEVIKSKDDVIEMYKEKQKAS